MLQPFDVMEVTYPYVTFVFTKTRLSKGLVSFSGEALLPCFPCLASLKHWFTSSVTFSTLFIALRGTMILCYNK